MGERAPSERWRELKELFQQALDSPALEREAMIARAAVEDPSLADELRSLLRAHEKEGQFFEEAVASEGRELLAGSRESAFVGRRIGPYQILRQIGSGGMGSVFLGRRTDEEYQSRVAIKVVRPGLLSEEALRRLRAERQALANLNHAN